jgi:putative ABC transport system substrate-binding protein
VRRREFIALLGGAVSVWPLAAHAQQTDRPRRIAVLMGLGEGDHEGQRWEQALLQALSALGWTRGANVEVDVRWAAADVGRMQGLAREIVASRPDVIVATTTPATRAVLEATRTIPVVFTVVSDPVGAGFVPNLPRPGGNVTGFIDVEAALGGKWLELLKQLVPPLARVTTMFNPATVPQTARYPEDIAAVAPQLGVAATPAPVHDAAGIEAAVASLAQEPPGGLIVLPDVFTATHRGTIIDATARRRVPAIYPFGFFAREGGLVSYGVDGPDLHRRAAVYVDRILKGAQPANLPVQAPVKFELLINLKTARALGLTVPPTLLAVADEVIE